MADDSYALKVPAGAHAKLGASNSERWMNCPGSVKAEEGLPERDSIYAMEGTAAHTLIEMAFVHKRNPDFWLGHRFDVESEENPGTYVRIEVDEEMVVSARLWLEHIRPLAEAADMKWVEKKFDLAPLGPPVPMFGTADFSAYVEKERTLYVRDFKYGKGVAVFAEENTQGLFYALGAWVALAIENRMRANAVKWVDIGIVQPRILTDEGEPSVSTWRIPILRLRVFGRELLAAARRTLRDDAPRKADTPSGKWCKFCKAKPTCETFRDAGLKAAQIEFSDVVEGAVVLPSPHTMTVEHVAAVLEFSGLLKDWIGSVEGYALSRIEQGHDVPGYARKPKGVHRAFDKKADVLGWLSEVAPDVMAAEFYDPKKLKSPAQIEAALRKHKVKASIPSSLLRSKETTEYVLCRADDPNALASAPTEFSVLEEE